MKHSKSIRSVASWSLATRSEICIGANMRTVVVISRTNAYWVESLLLRSTFEDCRLTVRTNDLRCESELSSLSGLLSCGICLSLPNVTGELGRAKGNAAPLKLMLPERLSVRMLLCPSIHRVTVIKAGSDIFSD